MLQSLISTYDNHLCNAEKELSQFLLTNPTDTEVSAFTLIIENENKKYRTNLAKLLPRPTKIHRQVDNMDWKDIFTLTPNGLVESSNPDNHEQLSSFVLWLRKVYNTLDEDVIRLVGVLYIVTGFNNTATWNHDKTREYHPITIKEFTDVFNSTVSGVIYNKDGKEMKPTRAKTFADVITEYVTRYIEEYGEKPTYREFTKYLSRHYAELDNRVYSESHIRSTVWKKNLTDYFTTDETKIHTSDRAKVKVSTDGTVTVDASTGTVIKVTKNPDDSSISVEVHKEPYQPTPTVDHAELEKMLDEIADKNIAEITSKHTPTAEAEPVAPTAEENPKWNKKMFKSYEDQMRAEQAAAEFNLNSLGVHI